MKSIYSINDSIIANKIRGYMSIKGHRYSVNYREFPKNTLLKCVFWEICEIQYTTLWYFEKAIIQSIILEDK